MKHIILMILASLILIPPAYSSEELKSGVQETQGENIVNPHKPQDKWKNGRAQRDPAEDDKIVKECLTVLAENPDSFEANLKLGTVYFNKGEYNKALPLIDKCLEIEGGNVSAMYIRGLIYESSKDFQAAYDIMSGISASPGADTYAKKAERHLRWLRKKAGK